MSIFGPDFKAMNSFALQQTRFTPDIATLELSEFQAVFVCDDVMRAGKNYPVIGDCSARVSKGFTQQSFNFYRKNTDGTPVVMLAPKPKNRYDFSAFKIKGEIHMVKSGEGMIKLDTHYQNGIQYRRFRAKILYPVTPHGMVINRDSRGKPLPHTLQGCKHFLLPERVDIISAWMYVGTKSYWEPLLDGGYQFEPVSVFEPKKERDWLLKYYHYRNRPG